MADRFEHPHDPPALPIPSGAPTEVVHSPLLRTTQTAIARLEGGRIKPSTRTLERYAKATGHRLVIGFEPKRGKADGERAK